MKLKAILFASVIALTACQNSTNAPSASNNEASKIVASATETTVKAALVFAEWCGGCKILDPKIEAIKAANTYPGVEFITLDYTDKNADNFYAQAESHGIKGTMEAALDGTIKTGRLYLIDSKTNKLVKALSYKMSDEDIAAAFTKATS